MKYKIVLISDTHRNCESLIIPECDILIHSGDEDLNSEQSCMIFNDWLGRQPAKIILFVPGNHDFYLQDELETAKMLLFNCNDILIDKEYITDSGLRIYGTPYVPRFYDWAFMKPDLNLQKHWDLIPPNLDILVTHGPPFSILDKNGGGTMCGSQTLYKHIVNMEFPPSVHCFGHIHESRGEKLYQGNKEIHFINAACCPIWTSDGYKEFEPIVLDYEK